MISVLIALAHSFHLSAYNVSTEILLDSIHFFSVKDDATCIVEISFYLSSYTAMEVFLENIPRK